MKITDYRTYVVGNKNPGKGGRYFIFVQLITDGGIVGLGEVYAASFGPHVFAKMIADVVERHVIGHNPFHIERLTRRIYGRGFSFRPDISLAGVISGLEMACWDIVGKECNKPVYELLGGQVHEKLRSYTYLYPSQGMGDEFYQDADASAEVAAQMVAQGYTAIKLDPAGPYSVFDGRQPALHVLSRCEEFMKKIRAAVGDRADILFGTHGQFSVSGALRMAEVLQPYKPLWFEEPVPPDMPEAMAKVAKGTSIPIATGERLCSRFEFQRVLETGAASILQMDLGRSGGLLESKKIAGIADTYYAHIAPHNYCGPVVGA
ncbi:MAG: mandelate racemase/muconate lactonizing enzyme family protein, partial [Pseudomonadota bacterium]